MTTYFVDYEDGNDSNDGLSFANRKQSFSSLPTLSGGDAVRVKASPAPTDTGVDATWTNNSETVTLSAALNATIEDMDADWVDVTNVTASHVSDRKQGTGSLQLTIDDAFTTGKAAYKSLGTLDFSGYEQISFWIKVVNSSSPVDNIDIVLCSDSSGDTPVDTLTLPALPADGVWRPCVIDNAGALGSAIDSVAIYINNDYGEQTILIDNLIAVRAAGVDALSHKSLIGKANSMGAGGDDSETWYGIKAIETDTITLDAGPSLSAALEAPYVGFSETVAAYIREPILIAEGTASSPTQIWSMSGTLAAHITVSGGWNRTDMSTQTDHTWCDGEKGLGYGLQIGGVIAVDFSRISFVRYQVGVFIVSSSFTSYTEFSCTNNDAGIGGAPAEGGLFVTDSYEITLSDVFACNNTCHSLTSSDGRNITGGAVIYRAGGIDIDGLRAHGNCGLAYVGESIETIFNAGGLMISESNGVTGTTISASSNNFSHVAGGITDPSDSGGVVFFQANDCILRDVVVANNLITSNAGNHGGIVHMDASAIRILGGSSSGNSQAGVSVKRSLSSLFDFTIGETTEVAFADGLYNNSRVFSSQHDGTTDAHKVLMLGGALAAQTSVRHTAADIAWQLQPTSANRGPLNPVKMSLGQFAFAAAAQQVRVWLRRTNTALTLGLRIRGGQLDGVASDVVSTMTAAADTWEEVTLSFTPTTAGVAEVDVFAYGGSTHTGYVDDLTVNNTEIDLKYSWSGQPWTDPPTPVVPAPSPRASFGAGFN